MSLTTYNTNKLVLTIYRGTNVSLVCIDCNSLMYLTQLLKGRDYIRYINSIHYIKVIDNIILNLLSGFNILLISINDLLLERTKAFNNEKALLLPLYKQISGFMTFVYPTFESIINDIQDNNKSKNDIHFKYIYLTISILAYINNIGLDMCDLLYIVGKIDIKDKNYKIQYRNRYNF